MPVSSQLLSRLSLLLFLLSLLSFKTLQACIYNETYIIVNITDPAYADASGVYLRRTDLGVFYTTPVGGYYCAVTPIVDFEGSYMYQLVDSDPALYLYEVFRSVAKSQLWIGRTPCAGITTYIKSETNPASLSGTLCDWAGVDNANSVSWVTGGNTPLSGTVDLCDLPEGSIPAPSSTTTDSTGPSTSDSSTSTTDIQDEGIDGKIDETDNEDGQGEEEQNANANLRDDNTMRNTIVFAVVGTVILCCVIAAIYTLCSRGALCFKRKDPSNNNNNLGSNASNNEVRNSGAKHKANDEQNASVDLQRMAKQQASVTAGDNARADMQRERVSVSSSDGMYAHKNQGNDATTATITGGRDPKSDRDNVRLDMQRQSVSLSDDMYVKKHPGHETNTATATAAAERLPKYTDEGARDNDNDDEEESSNEHDAQNTTVIGSTPGNPQAQTKGDSTAGM